MIVDQANEVLLKEEKRKPREHSIYWPSQASIMLPSGKVVGECFRKSYYSIYAIPATNPSSLRSKRAMLYGKRIEESEISLLRKGKILLGEQVSFKKQYKHILIRGKVDAVALKQKNLGVEYKTGSGYWFQMQIWGGTTSSGSPKITNLLQVILYLDADGMDNPTLDFNEVALVYIDRGSCDVKEFMIQLDSGFPVIDGEIDYSLNVQDIYKRYYQLDKYIQKNELPPCDYTNYYSLEEAQKMYYTNDISKSKYKNWKTMGYGLDFECEYCPWLNKCKEDCLLK